MTMLDLLTPSAETISLESLASRSMRLKAAPIGVAAPEAVAFCQGLSALLLSDARARAMPELQALGFWLRPSSIIAMTQDYLAAPMGSVRAPRGIVFQIPPSNVPSLIGYTLALSLLGGNVTLARAPSAVHPAQKVLFDLITQAASPLSPGTRERIMILRYGHDENVTAALSALCDARMVWGGDETVRAIRAVPLAPLARETSFADRFSAAALNARRYSALSPPEREAMARAFSADLYMFDQMACSSPRLFLWIGSEQDAAGAGADFFPRVAAIGLSRYGAQDTGKSLAKLNAHFVGLHDLLLSSTRTYNESLTVMTLAGWQGVSAFKEMNYGFGLLLEARLEELRSLATLTEGRDQTLALWGFGEEEIQAFIATCGGLGFDRLVPVGQALSFDPIWDGQNLFDTLTRLVQVTV